MGCIRWLIGAFEFGANPRSNPYQRRNPLRHRIDVFKNLLIADSDHPITLGSQPLVAVMVIKLRFGQIMATPVNFNHQLGRMLREIGHVAADGRLPADMKIELP